MIRVNINENFPIIVALWDEETGENASGQVVSYDVRDMDDVVLSPPINGLLTESTVASGIYRETISINDAGQYICYTTCSGFYSSSEEIIVNSENIYDLTKQNMNHNLSVEDVLRTNSTPTASQTTRKVSLNVTDYLITKVKGDSDTDWDNPVASGIMYAWYRSTADEVPYKMADQI